MKSAILNNLRASLKIIRLFIQIAFCTFIANSSYSQEQYYITNGTVNDMLITDDKLYLGGQFTALAEPRGSFATLNTNGTFSATIPKVGGGEVRDIVPDGSGGWFIGGNFTTVSNLTFPKLAHILSTGALDTTWNPSPNGDVNVLHLDGTTLFVGGEFTFIDEDSRTRLASFDTTTLNLTTFAPTINGSVKTIDVESGTIYIGGSFSVVNATFRSYIAAITVASNTLTAFDAFTNGTVNCIVVNGTTIYFGGSFTTAGDLVPPGGHTYPVNNLASASIAVEPRGEITSWTPYAGGIVQKFIANSSHLFVAEQTSIKKYDIITGVHDATWTPDITALDGVLSGAISGDGSTIYLGGGIPLADSSERDNLIAVDTVTAVVTATASFNPFFSGAVQAIAIDGSTLAVGGSFGGFGVKTSRTNLAAIDLKTGQPTSFAPNVNQSVNKMLTDGTKLYFVGGFSQVNGLPRLRAAAVNLNDASTASWYPSPGVGSINDMVWNGSNIILGGFFTEINGTSRTHLAEVDSNTATIQPLNVTLNNSVESLAINSSELYLGGVFTEVNATPRNRLAKITLPAGTLNAWDPDADGLVSGMQFSESVLLISGNFNNIGGSAYPKVAILNTVTGVPFNWQPELLNPGLVIDFVNDVIAGESSTGIFLAGRFNMSGTLNFTNQPFLRLNYLGEIQGSALQSRGIGTKIYQHGTTTQIFGAGSFTGMYGEANSNIAVINGSINNLDTPTISGTMKDGQTITGALGYWIGVPTFSYTKQWLRCDSSISSCSPLVGETNFTYLLTPDDVGSVMRFEVTANDRLFSGPVTSEVNTAIIDPINTELPVITGTEQEGEVLGTTVGAWNGVAGLNFLYQWNRCNAMGAGCIDIASATTSTYVLTLDDVGSTIKVTVRAQKNGSPGNNATESANTGVISAMPTATPTSTSTATTTPTSTSTPTSTVTPTSTPTSTNTPIQTATPSATSTVIVLPTTQPTPRCSPPKPSVRVSSGKIVVKNPRVSQLLFCKAPSLKASLRVSIRGRLKTVSAKFKPTSRRPGAKKVATLKIKPALKNKSGVVVLTAIDTDTSLVVSGVQKRVKTK